MTPMDIRTKIEKETGAMRIGRPLEQPAITETQELVPAAATVAPAPTLQNPDIPMPVIPATGDTATVTRLNASDLAAFLKHVEDEVHEEVVKEA